MLQRSLLRAKDRSVSSRSRTQIHKRTLSCSWSRSSAPTIGENSCHWRIMVELDVDEYGVYCCGNSAFAVSCGVTAYVAFLMFPGGEIVAAPTIL